MKLRKIKKTMARVKKAAASMKNFSDVLRAGKRWSPYAFVAGAGIWLPKAEAATLVNVDVTGYPLGPANTLTNTGTVLGDFISSGASIPVVTNIDGVIAVAMTDVAGAAAAGGQQYQGPATPTAVGGANKKTIEAWIFDPGPRFTPANQIQFEKVIFSMGRRVTGGNFALEHGLGEDLGALSTATEQNIPNALGCIGWNGDTNVVTNAWVYLVATYDGRTMSVYSDGVLRNSETYDLYVQAVNTALLSNDNSTNTPMRIARQTLNVSPPAAASGAGVGPFYLGRLRVKDTNMTSAEVLAQYNSEKSAFNYTDSDSNGMADWWEIRYFGAIGQNPAGNPDGDGLTNLQEYNARTNPTVADTDGDGLSDSQEVNVTLTDPTKADTDGDGLSDGYEVATSLTNPLVADSDGDGFSDGVEVAKGTNPNSAGSFPAAVVNLDATGLPLGNLTNWVNNGSIGGTFDAVQVTNTPKVTNIFGVKGVNFTLVGGGGGTNGTSYLGPVVPTQLTGSGARTIEAWIYNATVQDEETMFAWGARGGNQGPDAKNVSFGESRNPNFGAVAQWGQSDIGWNNQEVYGRWVNLAYTYDGTNTTRVYVDGKLANTDVTIAPGPTSLLTQANGVDGQPYHFRIARQNQNINIPPTGPATGSWTNIDGTGFGEFTMSRIRVYDVKFDEATLRAHFNAEKGTYGLTDTDGDGMPDWYEDAYGLNKNSAADAGLDPDGDGLTNLQEYQAGYNIPTQGTAATIALKPNVADTDGDLANDGAEVNRTGGFYGPAGASPTNPFNPDTDNDGLRDGVETDTGILVSANNTGTSPLRFDCDADGFSDGFEVSQGSNPNLFSSTPNPAPIVNLVATNLPLGALTAWTNSGQFGGFFNAENGGGNVALVQGVNGMTMPGLSSYVSTNAAGAGLVTGDPFYTVEAWVFNPSIADEETIIGWGRRGGPDGTMSAFTDGSDGTWGAITHWGAPDLSWNGANVRSPTRWKYLSFTYNPTTRIQNVYTDGGPGGTNAVLANTETLGPALAIADSIDGGVTHLPFRVGDETGGGGGPATANLPGFSFTGTIGEVRVYSRVLTVAEMGTNITKGAAAYGILNDIDNLPIWWKRFYGFPVGTDVSGQDPDGDGLSNAEEFNNPLNAQGLLGTNPLIADTDGDGLSDGLETHTIISNPNNADTSLDGLPDKTAVDLGLDPKSQDTDGDGFDDATEVLYGTNPNDGGSMPDISTPRPFVNLDATALPVGPLPVWTNNNALGWNFVASAGAVANVQIVAGTAAVMFNGTNWYTGLGEPYSFATNASRTVEAWVYDPTVEDEETVLAWSRRGGPDGSNNALSYGRNAAFGAIQFWGAADLPWGTNAAQIVSNTPAAAWTHIAFTYDKTASNRTCYVNGTVANSSTNFGPLNTYLYDPSDRLNSVNPPLGRSLPFRVGCQNDAGANPSVPFATMAIARIKAYNTNLAAAQIAADYNAEKVLFPGQPLITKVGYNPVSKAITFDWTPNPGPGRSYRVETNSDLGNPAGWGPAATGLSAGPFTNSAGTSQKFYRIRVD